MKTYFPASLWGVGVSAWWGGGAQENPCCTGDPLHTQETPSTSRDPIYKFPLSQARLAKGKHIKPSILPHPRGHGGAAYRGGLVEAGKTRSIESQLLDSEYFGDQQAWNSRAHEIEMPPLPGRS